MATSYHFDGWTLDADAGELRRGPTCIRLQEHPLRVLQALLEAPGEVVTREKLISRLWPNGVVEFEMGLNTAVRRLRVALGDDADAPRYIETLPRKGYRFIFPVDSEQPAIPAPEVGEDAAPASAAIGPVRRPRWRLVVAAGLAIAIALAGWYGSRRQTPPSDADLSIAVLPFLDLGGSPAQDSLANGATEDIATILGKFPELRVIGRTSALYFKGRTDDIRSIGRQLGVAYLVEGSVRRSGTHIRMTADLVESSSGRRLWSNTYDREVGDLLDTQVQIATSIARSLHLAVTTDVARSLANAHNMEAYSLYLRGREVIDRGDMSTPEAKTYFTQALASDPLFVRAAEALALAYLEEVADHYSPAEVAWPRAVEAARKALRLDPGSMLAHALLGLEYATYEYDWRAANRELDIVEAANPRNSDVLYVAAWLAFDLGRQEEALRLQDAALALDPLNPDSLQNSAYIRFLMRDYTGAEKDFRRSTAVSPTFIGNHRMLGRILLERRQPELALEEMIAEPQRDLGLAYVYYALGRRAESDLALARAIENYRAVGPVNVALVYSYRSEADQAISWLKRAVTEHDINLGHELRYDPAFDGLRSYPGYHEILRSMHLE